MTTSLTLKLAAGRQVNTLWAVIGAALVVMVALFVHSYNMFANPLYLGDEGIYMSQAYAVLKLGRITPYTYWYDHAPVGWLFIALWTALTGGFYSFGSAVDSGRAFMLLLHSASLILIYYTVLRLTVSTAMATATGLLYTLSPLTVIYGRLVLLDNIMIFWVLVATVIFIQQEGKLWPIIFSGFFFGVAVLTKEIALFLMPAFLYALWRLVEKNHARFARAGWLYGAIATISLYPLYAALRKELFHLSFTSPLSGEAGSVSLVGSMLWQFSRSGGAPWHPTSDFYHHLMTDWVLKDPWLLGLSVLAILWNLFRQDHPQRFIALLSVFAILAIAHGNPVFNFYIISVAPFLVLNIGLAIADLAGLLGAQWLPATAVVTSVAIGWFNLSQQTDIFTVDLTGMQHQAIDWLRDHAPEDAQIVVDDYLWVDLRDGGTEHHGFPGAHSHWKVANDPAVYHDLFHDDWRLIDYLVVTPELEALFKNEPDSLTFQAYSHSSPLVKFGFGTATVEIRKVHQPGVAVKAMLTESYERFVSQYIEDGQVKSDGGFTDARDQAMAMLMAVWMDDQKTFDELWLWTGLHLQSESGLLHHSNEPGVDSKSLTDADTDAALALLLAERRWRDASYGRHAKRMIEAIWEHEVVEIDHKPYLAAGDWAVSKKQIIFAPATFAPYAYYLFAEADPDHNWWYLLDTNYKLLADITAGPLGEQQSAGLPPAYVGLDRQTGKLLPNPPGAPISDGNVFNEQAAQVYWRVGLDAQWHDDDRPDEFLTASNFLHKEWEARGQLVAGYTHTGQPQTTKENINLYSAVLAKFLVEDPEAADELFATKLAIVYDQLPEGGRWGDDPNIKQEYWAWLATGLYNHTLKDHWEE